MEGDAGSTQLFPECNLKAPMIHGLMAAPLMGKNRNPFGFCCFSKWTHSSFPPVQPIECI